MKLLLADLDGTLAESWTTKILPGVAQKLTRIKSDGVAIAVVTNQGGVGYRRHTDDETYPDLADVLDRMGAIATVLPIDRIYVALHHGRDEWPSCDDVDSVVVDADDSPYVVASWRPDWRKPGSGMLMQACEDFDVDPANALMIGDSDTDRINGFAFQWGKEFFSEYTDFSVPANIFSLRNILGLSVASMATCCGIHRDTYGKWERGEQRPPAAAQQLFRLIEWMGDDQLKNWMKHVRG